jgi:ferredoxin
MYSNPAATDRPGLDFDAAGRIDAALLERLGVSPRAHFYLCGPPTFMRVLGDGLRSRGTPVGNIFTEVFGALESITPGVAQVEHAPHPPPGAAGSGPSISFARSGLTVVWDSKFRSLLELAEACDVPVRWSCRTGVCHTCMTGLIGGSVDYDPEPLERPSPGNVLVCCARPQADTTIDL